MNKVVFFFLTKENNERLNIQFIILFELVLLIRSEAVGAIQGLMIPIVRHFPRKLK